MCVWGGKATFGTRRKEYLRKGFSVKFDIRVCQSLFYSERFAVWVGCGDRGKTKKREPIITLITAPVRARPQQNMEKKRKKKKHTVGTKAQSDVACRNLLPKLRQENSNNILVGLYPPSNEMTIKRNAEGGNHLNLPPLHHPPFILWYPRYQSMAAKNEH